MICIFVRLSLEWERPAGTGTQAVMEDSGARHGRAGPVPAQAVPLPRSDAMSSTPSDDSALADTSDVSKRSRRMSSAEIEELLPPGIPLEERVSRLRGEALATLAECDATVAGCSSNPLLGRDPQIVADLAVRAASLFVSWATSMEKMAKRDRSPGWDGR